MAVIPLAELQKELEARTADNLTPIAIHSATLEIEAVVSALNDLVSRLTSTLDNERLFTADVAHELRTPLAGVRLHLELLAKTHPMVTVNLHCPRCQSVQVYRHGQNPKRHDRFRGRDCHRVFQLSYCYEPRKPGVKDQIAQNRQHDCGVGAVARQW